MCVRQGSKLSQSTLDPAEFYHHKGLEVVSINHNLQEIVHNLKCNTLLIEVMLRLKRGTCARRRKRDQTLMNLIGAAALILFSYSRQLICISSLTPLRLLKGMVSVSTFMMVFDIRGTSMNSLGRFIATAVDLRRLSTNTPMYSCRMKK